ncbi:hypothetical protein [Roseateles sp.]|jgi:hypothetical protein|uniref:hypothetical protein n=1 Tax=Roseateles sp. TaxID=1971397 RepID=UPI0037C6D98C
MAISWMTALKLIPWADVIEATPALVKGARSLLKRTQKEAAEAAEPAAPPSSLPEALTRVQHLESELAQLTQAQAESAALLESLAEQQARLVEAVQTLKLRSRLLTAGLALALVLAVPALWLASR